MKVRELMERTGSGKFIQLKAWIQDAMIETQLLTGENIVRNVTGIVAGKRYYDLPDDLVQLKNVRVWNSETSVFEVIPRMTHADSIDDDGGG